MNKYHFQTTSCPICGFLQIKNPFWLQEAYSDAIATCDTGLVARNLSIASRLPPLLFYLFGTDCRYVDYAGGTGLLVRLMRDVGFDFYWKDPYCTNIHARGFDFTCGQIYRAITAFEVLEHLTNPMEFVINAFRETNAEAMFFSTELFSGPPPKSDQWWYYAPETGQHISFYQAKTLEKIAENLKMKFATYSGIHVFCHPNLYDRFQFYHRHPIIRLFVRYKTAKTLKSKTTTDHYFVLGKKVAN